MRWQRLVDGLVFLCRAATGIAFAILIFAVLTQVIGRTLASSPVWTEELTRFALLYLVAFGAGLSFRNGELVNVDIVCEALPGRLPWILRLVSALVTAMFAAILIFPAWSFTSIGALQTSPAMFLRMDFVHASVLVLIVLLFVFAAMRIIGMLTGATDGLPVAGDDGEQPQ